MRVVSVNTDAATGGAARVALRLHVGLQRARVDSTLVTMRAARAAGRPRSPRQLAASARARLDGLPRSLYRDRVPGTFSPAWLPNPRTARLLRAADVVHLHWIGDGMLSIEQLGRLRRPCVWTMHDLWPFTGGCHYPGDCERFRDRCHACPALRSERDTDLSTLIQARKRRAYAALTLTAVAPSRWLAELARASSLFRDVPVEVIANGIDTATWRPRSRDECCAAVGADPAVTRILFGGAAAIENRLKGFDLLLGALERVQTPDVELATFGSIRGAAPVQRSRDLGTFVDEAALARAYGACDVYALPSREDNLPNVLVEAMACGVPCVAFDIGGVGDVVDHQVNGYLARPFDVGDFARGLDWVLADRERHRALATAAREKVERCFDLDDCARAYSALYARIAGSEAA